MSSFKVFSIAFAEAAKMMTMLKKLKFRGMLGIQSDIQSDLFDLNMSCVSEFWLFGKFLDNRFSKNNKVISALCGRQISEGLNKTKDAGHNEKHLEKGK